jgi:hypothetical protein
MTIAGGIGDSGTELYEVAANELKAAANVDLVPARVDAVTGQSPQHQDMDKARCSRDW